MTCCLSYIFNRPWLTAVKEGCCVGSEKITDDLPSSPLSLGCQVVNGWSGGGRGRAVGAWGVCDSGAIRACLARRPRREWSGR